LQNKKLPDMADTVAAIPLSQVSGHYEISMPPLVVTGLRWHICIDFSSFQGAGYGVVIGLGALFALGMMAVTEIMKRRGNILNSEEFTGL
jgi:hypothetical protein